MEIGQSRETSCATVPSKVEPGEAVVRVVRRELVGLEIEAGGLESVLRKLQNARSLPRFAGTEFQCASLETISSSIRDQHPGSEFQDTCSEGGFQFPVLFKVDSVTKKAFLEGNFPGIAFVEGIDAIRVGSHGRDFSEKGRFRSEDAFEAEPGLGVIFQPFSVCIEGSVSCGKPCEIPEEVGFAHGIYARLEVAAHFETIVLKEKHRIFGGRFRDRAGKTARDRAGKTAGRELRGDRNRSQSEKCKGPVRRSDQSDKKGPPKQSPVKSYDSDPDAVARERSRSPRNEGIPDRATRDEAGFSREIWRIGSRLAVGNRPDLCGGKERRQFGSWSEPLLNLPVCFVSFLAGQAERNARLGLESGSRDLFPASFANAVSSRIDPLECMLNFFLEEEFAFGDGGVDFHGFQFSGAIATYKVLGLVCLVEELLMIPGHLCQGSQLFFQSFAKRGDVFGFHVPGKGGVFFFNEQRHEIEG